MARLPTPGKDDNIWGDVLNDYLAVEHTASGALKRAADIDIALSTAQAAQTSAQTAQTTATGAIQSSAYTTKGDILAASANATPARLGVGVDGRVLTADSSQTTGLAWTVPPSALVSSVVGQTGAVTGTQIAADAALISGYQRTTNRNVWALGDSLTAGAGAGGGGVTYDPAVYADTGQGGLWYQGGSWVPWALLASGCRWTVRGVFATGGFTAAQILATHVPAVIAAAAKGDTVVVLAGTNGNAQADVMSIHATLRAAGLNTVAVTIPPSTSSTLSVIYAFNQTLKTYAFANGIPLVDVHSAMVDTTTGAYQTAYNGDGIHPNQLGCQLMGVTIANVLSQIFITPQTLVNHNAAMTGSLQGKPLALSSPTLGTEYNSLSALGTSTMTTGAVAGFNGGNGYIFTRGDTNISARMANMTFVAGHRYRIGMALIASVSSGSWSLRLESNTTGLKMPWGLGYTTAFTISQPICRFFSEFTLPAGLPDYGYRMRVSVNGSGTVLSLGEVTFEDLTVTGG